MNQGKWKPERQYFVGLSQFIQRWKLIGVEKILFFV